MPRSCGRRRCHDGRVIDLLTRLARLDTASLCDAGAQLRVAGPELRPIVAGTKMVGRAVTADSGGDLMPVLGALELAGPGDVLVVAAGGPRAVAGELFVTEARRRGLAGIVVDGFCRDVRTVARLGLPVFARGATPRAAPAMAVPTIQVPVIITGIEVHPGDIVVGDDDGIVIGTEAHMLAAIGTAETIVARERTLRQSIEDGVSLFDRMTYREHAARLGEGEPSALRFPD
jgi:4-hydroxy-4-methyl-2-oxoglutarate aldolase